MVGHRDNTQRLPHWFYTTTVVRTQSTAAATKHVLSIVATLPAQHQQFAVSRRKSKSTSAAIRLESPSTISEPSLHVWIAQPPNHVATATERHSCVDEPTP